MRNKILILAVITSVIFLSGCIQSDVSNINSKAITINNHLQRGDSYFNMSAADTNQMQLNKALSECNNATNEYNQAQTAAQDAYQSATNSNDAIFVEYLQNVLGEVQAKLNATSELKTAINLLQANQTASADDHLTAANSYMQSAMTYQKNAENIVNQNPSKFKGT